MSAHESDGPARPDVARRARPSFWSAIAFAAIGAALLPAFVVFADSLVERTLAVALYLVALTVAHVAWLAPARREAVAGGLVAMLGGGVLLLVSPLDARHGLVEVAIGCTVLISLIRSTLYYRRAQPLRAVVQELALGLGGLLVARICAGPSVVGIATAVWGFGLVQSLFCLLPGLTTRRGSGDGGDAFERASSRLRALLDDA